MAHTAATSRVSGCPPCAHMGVPPSGASGVTDGAFARRVWVPIVRTRLEIRPTPLSPALPTRQPEEFWGAARLSSSNVIHLFHRG
eukprot:scaffold17583_cov92-Phaeocystis_antarctica.AAC.1